MPSSIFESEPILGYLTDTYTPPTVDNKHKKKDKKQRIKPKKNQEEVNRKSLFDALPFKDETLAEEEEEEDIQFACITYIPEIAPQLKRSLSKAGIHTTFTSAPKLKDLLCGKNRTKPPPEKKKGIYKYACDCSDKAIYIGQTARSYEVRWAEHERATHKEQWHHSGLTQHLEHCPHSFNKENFTPVNNIQGKHRRQLAYDLKIREALEIRRHNAGPGKGLNEDMGAYVKTDMWDPVLSSIGVT